MSNYARNHLQDDWASQAAGETARLLREAERTATWYFDRATRRQRSRYEAELGALLGLSGPKWDRSRNVVRRSFRETTAEACVLFEATVQCLLDTGEVTEDLDEAWTKLCEREDLATPTAE